MSKMTTAESVKPPLKWAGGKRWQVPHLLKLWAGHEHRRLVEPFCGGLSVALGLSPGRALLNDVNPHLINFYWWVKLGLEIEIPMANDETLYYQHRDRFNALIAERLASGTEAASLFYYLNKTGFNGLCRFNQSGKFNVPFGKRKSLTYARTFHELHARLAGWMLTSNDVAQVPIEAGDFVYADPPYDVEFTTYSQGGFSWADQTRTAIILAEHAGPVVLVNQATPRIEELYRGLGFDVTFLDAPRRISCTGDRTPAREIMATRNLAVAAVAA